MSAVSRKDRIMGTIMGTLIGDALGVGPHWYYDLELLKHDYGPWIDDYLPPRPKRYHVGLKAGENSQTGQVFTLLLESVAVSATYNEEDFTDLLDGLLLTLDGTPKGGRYTDQAMRDVWRARQDGRPWSAAGSFADTAEAAIRMPVLAARYSRDFAAAFKHMLSNIRLTHQNPFIVGQSAAFGLIVWSLLNEAPVAEASGSIGRQAREHGVTLAVPVTRLIAESTQPEAAIEGAASFHDAILQPSWAYAAAHNPAINIEPASSVCQLFGLACTLGFMLPAAYYLVSRFENDFEMAVLSAINGGGNNMARASLTGALSGAQVGLSGIPERFITGLNNHELLKDLAKRIAEAA